MQVIGAIYFISLIVFMILSINANYTYFGGKLFFVTAYLWNLDDGIVYPKLVILLTLPFEVGISFFFSPVVWMVNKYHITSFWYDLTHLLYIAGVGGGVYLSHKVDTADADKIQQHNIFRYYSTGEYEGNPGDQIVLCRYILDNCGYPFNRELSRILSELSICYHQNASLSFMSLAGSSLELALKQKILISNLQFKDHWMLGELYKYCIENCLLEKESSIDQSIKTINAYRKHAVHISGNDTMITRNQVELILYSVLHVIWSISVQNCRHLAEEGQNVENTK